MRARKGWALAVAAIVMVGLVANHRQCLPQPSCDTAWLRRHLRDSPNPPLSWLARSSAKLSSPFKRLGVRGWSDLCYDAQVTGVLLQAAYSNDGFRTLDLEIERLSVGGLQLWDARDGRRFIRIEYDTTQVPPAALAEDGARWSRLRTDGQRVWVRGRLRWDFDGSGHLEIHPRGPEDIRMISNSVGR